MTPDWHDYPTGPGVWRMRITKCGAWGRRDKIMQFFDHNGWLLGFGDHTTAAEPPECTDKTRKIRYYGPLPHDPQDQGETNK